MGLAEFFSRQQQSEQAQPVQQKKQFTNNKNINSFCERFYEKAGADYKNTPANFIKLAFCNIGLLMEILKSPEVKEIEDMANTAMNKGIISKDTLLSFSKVIDLFKIK